VAQALLKRMAELKPSGQAGVGGAFGQQVWSGIATAASHVRDEFADMSTDELLILEAGPSEVGIESTIVDVSRTEQGLGAVLLRPGHITGRHDCRGHRL
jgi:L-threonylcarbamoyladenylate synthase